MAFPTFQYEAYACGQFAIVSNYHPGEERRETLRALLSEEA